VNSNVSAVTTGTKEMNRLSLRLPSDEVAFGGDSASGDADDFVG
jgi:hypothetical protein